MTRRGRQYAVLWHAAIAQAHPRAHAILLWSMASITLLVATVIALGLGWRAAIGWALCTPAGILLFAWTMSFVPGAVGLNSPANAQLVPGMRARLVELTLLVWLGAMGVFSAGLFVLQDAPAPTLLMTISITLGVASGLAGLGGSLIILAPLLIGSLVSKLAPGWLLDALYSPAASALALASLLPLGLLVTQALLPRAGERHWRMQAHRERMVGAGKKGYAPGGLLGSSWIA